MEEHPRLLITSPAAGTITNSAAANITVSFNNDTYELSKFRWVRLFINETPVAIHEFSNSGVQVTYTFENIDLSPYANNGYINIQARGYHLFQDLPEFHYSYHFANVNVLVDTIAPQVSIITPAEGEHLNNPRSMVTANLTDSGTSHLNKSTIKIYLNNDVIDSSRINKVVNTDDNISIQYEPETNLPDSEYSFSIEVKDNAGNSVRTADRHFTIDTTPPVALEIFPSGAVAKERLTGITTVKVTDMYSEVDLSECSAYLISMNNKIINLEIHETGTVPSNTEFDIHFGQEGQISNLGIGNHKLHLKLSDTSGNTIEHDYDFEIQQAVPYNNSSYQVCRSFTDITDNAASEPYVLPPVFDYYQDMVIQVAKCIQAPEEWEFTDNHVKVKTEAGSMTLKVIISKNGIWSSSTQIRQNLAASFKKALAAIESRETDLFIPGTSYCIQTLVPRLVPLSGSETFAWYCGMDTSLRSIQLMPGFRVRITPSAYQYCGPGRDEINSMVTQGDIILPVVRKRAEDGAFITCFDPLLYSLAPYGYSTGDDELLGKIGGIFDLFAGGMSRRHMALVMPATIPSVFTDSAGRDEHVTLAAADSRTILDSGIRSCSAGGTQPAGCVLRSFQGRSSITVEFPVKINGSDIYVPVGTTLRQVCDKEVFGFAPDMLKSGQVSWNRQWSAAPGQDSGSSDIAVLKDMQWTELGLAPAQRHMNTGDMPLLPGDRIDIRVIK